MAAAKTKTTKKRKTGADRIVDLLAKMTYAELSQVAPRLVEMESEVASFLAGKLWEALPGKAGDAAGSTGEARE